MLEGKKYFSFVIVSKRNYTRIPCISLFNETQQSCYYMLLGGKLHFNSLIPHNIINFSSRGLILARRTFGEATSTQNKNVRKGCFTGLRKEKKLSEESCLSFDAFHIEHFILWKEIKVQNMSRVPKHIHI